MHIDCLLGYLVVPGLFECNWCVLCTECVGVGVGVYLGTWQR